MWEPRVSSSQKEADILEMHVSLRQKCADIPNISIVTGCHCTGCDVGFSLSDEIDFHSWQEAELITIILSIDKQKHAHSGILSVWYEWWPYLISICMYYLLYSGAQISLSAIWFAKNKTS